MIVMKFGGTSVGTPQRMKEVASLVTKDPARKIVVLSALSGTTNALMEISNLIAVNDRSTASEKINELRKSYQKFTEELLTETSYLEHAGKVLEEHFEFLSIILKISYSESLKKDILAQGEMLSSKLFSLYLSEQKIKHCLLNALDFMQIDKNEEPQIGTIKIKLSQILQKNKGTEIFVTQGYIAKNARGEVDNLKRGGSDYSASLIAAAIQAEVCEIWTDIDGMHNNDPRVITGTSAIEHLSFDEAAELSYFGAKVLHPASIWPAQTHNIPVRLLNTMQPGATGTTITEKVDTKGVKAVAAKDDIIAIKIKSSRMLLAHGFLRKIFEVFETYKTAIDMVTTSEVAVSVTIDNEENLESIVKELSAYGTVEVDKQQTIISIVGNEITETKSLMRKIFEALENIPVRMVSYGGSHHNISLLVPQQYKAATLSQLHKGLF